MSRNHDFISSKVCIVGRSGRGKSTLVRQLLGASKARFVFAFDHKDELKNKFGATQCRTWAQADAALAHCGSVCWKPEGALKKSLSVFLERVFVVCKQLPGRKLIHFDEPNLLLPKFATTPEEDAAGHEKDFWHPLQAALETGREWGIDILISAQRATHLHTDFRGQITQWIMFQSPAGWVAPLEKDFEEDFSEVSKKPEDGGLDVGHFLSYEVESGERRRGVTAKGT